MLSGAVHAERRASAEGAPAWYKEPKPPRRSDLGAPEQGGLATRDCLALPGDGGVGLEVQRIRRLVLASVAAAIALALAGELLVRALGRRPIYERDEALGWRPRANLVAELTARDQTGNDYAVHYATGPHGFRAFGDTAGSRMRVLFIGDSFTADPSTSNDEAYFGVVRSQLPVEVFAVGGSGYGTLQELLLARETVDTVKPDVFVLQYCPNDLSDNSHGLESLVSHARNQKNLRPYLVGDAIVFRLAKRHPYRLLYEHSRLFRKLDVELMKLEFRLDDPARRPEPDSDAIATQRAAAIAVTTDLMSRLAAAMPRQARLLTFSCDTSNPAEAQTWKAIARAAGFEAHASVSERVEAAERGGEVVRLVDGVHWNRLGNRIAGEELARVIAERGSQP